MLDKVAAFPCVRPAASAGQDVFAFKRRPRSPEASISSNSERKENSCGDEQRYNVSGGGEGVEYLRFSCDDFSRGINRHMPSPVCISQRYHRVLASYLIVSWIPYTVHAVVHRTEGARPAVGDGMNSIARIFVVCAVVAIATGQPAKNEFWRGTSMDAMVEQTKLECSQKNDEVACMKFKVLNLLDQLFRKDNFKISETVEVTRNSYAVDELTGRSLKSETSFLDTVCNYIASHDVTFKLPLDSTVKVSSRNINNDELSFDVKFGEGRAVEARKSKLKKVIIPILVFVLLKAMTLIPLAIGVLGLKAWNALQLSFFSFVVSVGLAIFQLCKKIAADSHAAPIAAHGPWEYQAAQYRSFQEVPQKADPKAAQDIAYSAYAQA